MAEMIIPGTYIEVRAEGLVTPTPVSISNVAVIGTARRGPVNEVVVLSSFSAGRDTFGAYDAYERPDETGNPLTLVRALELAYGNGAQNVFAVRVAGAGATNATYTLAASGGTPMTIEARQPGAGLNDAAIVVEDGVAGLNVSITTADKRLRETWRDVPAAAAEFAQVINGEHADYPFARNASTGGRSQLFRAVATGVTGNITAGNATAATPGASGAADASYGDALELLLNENVHIIVLAGQSDSTMATALEAHCQNASTDTIKRDRIGIFGAEDDQLSSITTHPDSDRLVYCGPGIVTYDNTRRAPVELPAAYTAAAVAGLIASLDPHVSPTNKSLRVSGVTTRYNGAQIEQILLGRALVLEDRLGAVKIVQGLTTASDTAWRQITTRRIVDYAKFGVRSACDPFIGKLNNDRVRQALKGTINSFLADMVDREMLISYDLDVSATRAQQIRGIAQVTMTLRPTFSIDYIRVVMNLE